MEDILFYSFILNYLGICFAGNHTDLTFCKAGKSIDEQLYLHVSKGSELPCLCQLSMANWTAPVTIYIRIRPPPPTMDCGMNIEIKGKESIENVKCNFVNTDISLNDNTSVILTLVNNLNSTTASFQIFARFGGKIQIQCSDPNFIEDNAHVSTLMQLSTTNPVSFEHSTLSLTRASKDITEDESITTQFSSIKTEPPILSTGGLSNTSDTQTIVEDNAHSVETTNDMKLVYIAVPVTVVIFISVTVVADVSSRKLRGSLRKSDTEVHFSKKNSAKSTKDDQSRNNDLNIDSNYRNGISIVYASVPSIQHSSQLHVSLEAEKKEIEEQEKTDDLYSEIHKPKSIGMKSLLDDSYPPKNNEKLNLYSEVRKGKATTGSEQFLYAEINKTMITHNNEDTSNVSIRKLTKSSSNQLTRENSYIYSSVKKPRSQDTSNN